MRQPAWFQLGAVAVALAVACGKETDSGPPAPVNVAAPPAPIPIAGTAGMGGAMEPTGGTGPTIPGLCDTSGWPADSTAYEQALFDAINAARAAGRSCGAASATAPGPLTLSPLLQASARCHALEMGERGEATFIGADGSDTFDRAKRAGYTGSSTSATVTATAKDAPTVLESLLVEPSICEKLALPKWVDIGVGVSVPSDTGKRYVNIVTGF